MKNIRFFVPLEKIPSVTAQQGHRTTKSGRHYKDERLTAAESLYTAYFARYRPDAPLSGPISLTMRFCYKCDTKHPHGRWKMTRPDDDNLMKAPRDVLTRLGFWKDDSVVASSQIQKMYWDTPGVYVSISEMPDTFQETCKTTGFL